MLTDLKDQFSLWEKKKLLNFPWSFEDKKQAFHVQN